MFSKEDKIPVELITRVVGKWKHTYHWIPIFGAVIAFAMAFFSGANNIPLPFSAPVASGSFTLLQVSIMACVIYIPGSAFASNSSVDTLFTHFLKQNQPNEGFLMWSMVVVLITATIWLALATYWELPVSTLQSTQGALLGTMLVTEGFSSLPTWNKNEFHDFNGGGLVWILLEWTFAPLVAFIITFLLFRLLKMVALRHENAEKRVLALLPICYGISAGLLCLFLMHQVIPDILKIENRAIGMATGVAVTLATLVGALSSSVILVFIARRRMIARGQADRLLMENSVELHDKKTNEEHNKKLEDNENDEAKFEDALKDYMQMRVLETVPEEEDERSFASPNGIPVSDYAPSVSIHLSEHSTPFKQLLESTPNRLIHNRNFKKMEKTSKADFFKFFTEIKQSTFNPVIEYDRHTLVRHALAEKFDETEHFFSFPQLLASCIFAIVQSATEISAVVSPFGALMDIFSHRAKYKGNLEHLGSIHVIWWMRGIGGFAATIGFFLWGWKLTQCLGGKLTYMSNSRGFASQLCTVATVIIMTRFKLPISSSHAFVGSLLGVGVADDPHNVNWKLFIKFLVGWVFTILFCSGVAYAIYSFTVFSPAYVVP